ncbi:MAG: hypothetical protein PUH02_08465 [bacterium]|nr:hypothetical protein [bacterium]
MVNTDLVGAVCFTDAGCTIFYNQNITAGVFGVNGIGGICIERQRFDYTGINRDLHGVPLLVIKQPVGGKGKQSSSQYDDD